MDRSSSACSATRRRRTLAGAVLLCTLVAACSSDDSDPASDGQLTTTTNEVQAEPDPIWPEGEWEVVSPEEAGLDPEALETVAATAEAGGSECLVVAKDGRLVGEWYWLGFDRDQEREVFSVTKSIVSTLVGLAQYRGLLDIDQPASDFITGWQGTPSETVTIRNLLSNDSGRERDFRGLASAPDQTGFAIGLGQEHEPGTAWVYNNSAVQSLDRVIEEATGMPTHEFAEEALFEPLGMDSAMGQDATGNTRTAYNMQASCRDLARFGHLYVEDGTWAGEQLISRAFVEEATSPSQEFNTGYGWLWWLNRPPEFGGRPTGWPTSGPDDMFAANGLSNQYVDVFPSWGVVVTRLGRAYGPGGAYFRHEDVAVAVRDARDGG